MERGAVIKLVPVFGWIDIGKQAHFKRYASKILVTYLIFAAENDPAI